MTKQLIVPALLIAFLSTGCDDSSSSSSSSSAPANAPTGASTNGAANATPPGGMLPVDLRLTSAPTGAKEVAELKQAVKDGDQVVVRGVVAGRAEPIATNRAILTLLDTAIKTCDKNPADGCKTPWDACCEPADVLAKNSLTVQVVDGEGRPLKVTLSSLEGVKPLAQLVVSGTVSMNADGAVLLNAKGIHVVR